MEDLLSYFDRIVCINRQDRPDRWTAAQAEFAKVGIQDRVLRLDAVVLPNLENACAQSHMRAVAQAKEAGAQRLLIFEDDAEFIDVAAIPPAVHELTQQPDWQLFYLGGYGSEAPGLRGGDAAHMPCCRHLFRILRGYLTTHAYAISSTMFDKFGYKMRDAVDRWLAYILQPNNLTLGMIRIAATQRNGYSDIKQKDDDRGRIVRLHNQLLENAGIKKEECQKN